jgi:phage terminase small subunit
MKQLSDKQRAFCEEYVANGYNASAAYRVAYAQENNDVCKSEGYKMIRKPHIQEGIKNAELDYRIVGHGLGINKECILKAIKEALVATKLTKQGVEDDHGARLKAIEVYARLTGDFSADKKSITIDEQGTTVDLEKMNKEERDAYKAKILAEL